MTAIPIRSRRWKNKRRRILARDNGRCRYRYPGCGVVATSVDHLVDRIADGAMWDDANLFSVCESCHREKERMQRRGEDVRAFLDRDDERATDRKSVV